MRTMSWLVPVLSVGCFETGEMGVVEALDALGEVNRSGQGDQATSEVIEISTDFTIGGALEDAAGAIADFWESQAPCTTVTQEGATTTIDYGTLDDGCTFEGRTYAGVNTVTIQSTTPGELEVLHDWNAFTDGRVTVDGGATVTWSGDDLTREVETDHRWTDNASGEGVDVHGEHVTGRLDADLPAWGNGFTLDGSREWTSDAGDWSLGMDGLEVQWLDPAPQTGSIDVTSPEGKTLVIVYARVDDDTISATLQGLRGGDRVYHISKLGIVTEAP